MEKKIFAILHLNTILLILVAFLKLFIPNN